ncbi:MAG: hypothetical protein IPF99_27005 [Deltaproteobacteria bacterium]|nr:hypothetical protein [Deltaproteobacteria bacterium]
MHRPHRLAVVALLLAGCSSGAVVGSDAGTTTTPPDNLDDWGGDRGSMMQSPGTGDFGIGRCPPIRPRWSPRRATRPRSPSHLPRRTPPWTCPTRTA